jgi:prophage antirepressor-like protein
MSENNELTIAPRVFNFNGLKVRVFDRAGDPWWVLSDVCQPLGIANPRDAASRLDDDEKDAVGIADAIGREQQTTIINESGLYSLILTSRKEQAKAFNKWVTG